MKTLQNNFTTPEQSKRLLELGVPADSADLYYQDYGSIPMVVWTLTQPRDLRRGILKPCWSVGRLMEIYDICRYYDGDYDEVYGKETYIETFISAIEEAILDDMFDFSKLEE